MPRGQYIRQPKMTVTKSQPVLVPETVYTSLNWWDRLDATEQKTVKTEGEHLAIALLNHGRSRLAIGEHLVNIRTVLEPKKLFVKFLKNFHFSVKTAYRYMNGFSNAKRELPETVLSAAMARGYNMIGESEQKPLGIYTNAVRQLPPPKDPTQSQANQWLDSVEQVRKKSKSSVTEFSPEIVSVPQDPGTLLKECYRFVENRFKKLPENARERSRWMKDLIGYQLFMAGIDKSTAFLPKTPPADFKAERGRPRLVETQAQAA